MIRVERASVDPPEVLSSPAAEEARAAAATFFRSRARVKRQQQHKFAESIHAARGVRSRLEKLFDGRCAFCCRPLAAKEARVHHLRPPQDAIGHDGSTSRSHYYWLAYDWSNLYLACAECSEAQGPKFPVDRPRAAPGRIGHALDAEMPVLLDPCRDDPELKLVYLKSGEVASEDTRGRATVDIFDLNRRQLIELRLEVIEETDLALGELMNGLVNEDFELCAQILRDLYSRTAPFAPVRRQFTNQLVQVRHRRIEFAVERGARGRYALRDLVGDLSRVTNHVMDRAATAQFGWGGPVTHMGPVHEHRAPQVYLRPQEPEPFELTAPAITRIEIKNFRIIESLDLDFDATRGDGRWTMLLGENGTGKSSVLHAVALALVDDETRGSLRIRPGALVRQGAAEGHVRISFSGRRRRTTLRFTPEGGFHREGPSTSFLLAGYGPTRLLPRLTLTDPYAMGALSSVENLFNPFSPLTDPAVWLPALSEDEFDSVAKAMKRLLLLADEEQLERSSDNSIAIIRRQTRVALSRESDGYQAMAAFALDLMRLLLTRWKSLEAAEGLVLIDELGTHLHPRWQMRVTHALRDALPRMNFIATTHDPLCLRGIRNGEAVVLRRTNRDDIYAVRDLPPIEPLPVDQLLTSEHFGLNSTIDPEIEERFSEYYALMALRERSAAEDRRLAELRGQFDNRRLLGSTQRERVALEAADEFLAEDRWATSEGEHLRLKDDTKRRIKELWHEVP